MLTYASVFEQAMLPHLSAVDVFRLACVSKGLQQWLLNIPPQRWQVCLGCLPAQLVLCDCTAGCSSMFHCCRQQRTSPLPTCSSCPPLQTSWRHCAKRKAYAARCNILAGRAPVQHEVTELFSLTESPSRQPWTEPCVFKSLFSSCGRYLAVAVQGHAVPKGHQRSHLDRSWDKNDSIREVLTYSTSESMQQQACFMYGCHQPLLHWAPDLPHLTIASLAVPALQGKHGISSQLPGVLVYDAQAAAVIYSLEADLLEVLGGVRGWRWHFDEVLFSPSGCSLLLTRVMDTEPHDSGMLLVVDVRSAKLVAQTPYAGPRLTPYHDRWPAIWRPDFQGLILKAGVTLQQASGFAAAGIALTRLPEHRTLEDVTGIGFASDGQYCLTRGERNGQRTEGPRNQYRLSKLCDRGDHLMHVLSFQAEEVQWVPSSLRAVAYSCPEDSPLLLHDDPDELSDMESWGEASLLDLSGSRVEETQSQGSSPLEISLQGPLVFSPSGRFLADSTHPRILDCTQNAVFNMVSDAAIVHEHCTDWDEKTFVSASYAACWLPSGAAVVYVPISCRAQTAMHTFRLT